jgi:hypothetical protein
VIRVRRVIGLGGVIGVGRGRNLAQLAELDLRAGDCVVAQPVARQRALLDQLVATD